MLRSSATRRDTHCKLNDSLLHALFVASQWAHVPQSPLYGFYLVFFGSEVADSVILRSASWNGTCWALSLAPLHSRSYALMLAAVDEEFFPLIDLVANAGFDPTGDAWRSLQFSHVVISSFVPGC